MHNCETHISQQAFQNQKPNEKHPYEFSNPSIKKKQLSSKWLSVPNSGLFTHIKKRQAEQLTKLNYL